MENKDQNHQKTVEELGYETADVPPRFFFMAAGSILAFTVFAAVVGKIFMNIPGVAPHWQSPRVPFKAETPPPGTPILQNNVTNTTDIRDLRQHEMHEMTTYAYSDKKSPVGVTYRIPIDQAIDEVSKMGITATQNWLIRSSHPVPGQLNMTPAGPSAGLKPLAPTVTKGLPGPKGTTPPLKKPKAAPKAKTGVTKK